MLLLEHAQRLDRRPQFKCLVFENTLFKALDSEEGSRSPLNEYGGLCLPASYLTQSGVVLAVGHQLVSSEVLLVAHVDLLAFV